MTAVLLEAQSFNYCRRREFDRAARVFAGIAKIRPLDAKNLIRWGEALRRTGGFTDAMSKFQQALLRLPPASPGVADEREYVSFKGRLTQIESSHGGELKEVVAQHLGEPTPSGYWLLTGAALALQKGDLPTGAELLKKAQAAFPPPQLQALLDDYFFRTYVIILRWLSSCRRLRRRNCRRGGCGWNISSIREDSGASFKRISGNKV